MCGGTIDTQLGRRGHFERCKYWVRDESDYDLSEYTYKQEPNGIFYAEEVTAKDIKKLVINGVFMFDESLITIQTKGQISLKQGDLIEFEGEMWIVQSCQQKKFNRNNQFMKRPSVITYIQIKK